VKSGVWIALITAVLLTAFWDTRVILPFKLLVVLVHEMWHGISAMAAGATIDRIILHPGEAGETLVRNLKGTWGVIFSVSAGYVGTTTTGALLLRRGLVESFERLSLCIFAGLILYMTVLFTAPGSLGFNSGLGWSLTLLFAASLGDRYARNGLLIVGTVFIWYSVFDLLDFTRDARQTDAGILARYLKSKLQLSASLQMLSMVTCGLWILVILGIIWAALGSIIIMPPAPAPAPAPEPVGVPTGASSPLTAAGAPANAAPAPDIAAPIAQAAPTAPGNTSPASKNQVQPIPNHDMAELLALRAEIEKDKNLHAPAPR